ncbi:MAG TPA: hypothetical protein VFR81_10105 [Longimicrobium sp.]|nr:hypothetical protein [Longimicrobium sp.]
MRRPLMLFVLLALCGCDRPRAAPPAAEQDAPARADSAPAPLDSAIFIGGDSATGHTLRVTWKTRDQIDFRFVLMDRTTGDQKQLEGSATDRAEGDPEMDEDENGMSYAADEFSFEEGECSFKARIDQDGARRAKVTATSGCPFDLPLESAPVLRRLAG